MYPPPRPRWGSGGARGEYPPPPPPPRYEPPPRWWNMRAWVATISILTTSEPSPWLGARVVAAPCTREAMADEAATLWWGPTEHR